MTYVDACTIASNNYLALARVFAESYLAHHPGARVYVCIADRPDPRVDYASLPFIPIFAEDLGIPAFFNMALRYDILELNTGVKPFLLAYLRDRCRLERVFYFDPDILVQDTLTGLHEALESSPAVLTPHITAPLDDAHYPPERMILMSGVYNLGFLGLKLDESTRVFLDWWQERLYRFCLRDVQNGLFVDQSWMDLAPALLDHAAVVRDPIYNVAYWNLPQRRPVWVGDHWQIDGRRGGFFHFSGLDLADLNAISRHQDRLSLSGRPEIKPLFEHYRQLLEDAGHEALARLPYGFTLFSTSEIPVPWVARRALQRADPKGLRWADPFDIHCEDSFFEWLIEPIAYPAGTLNRTTLALWEERDDLVRAFPQVCGEDLRPYADWLIVHGEGVKAGLHPVFLDPVRAHGPGSPERRSTFSRQLHPYTAAVTDKAAELLARTDLTRPGAMTLWLNEPVPGTASAEPVITRLALLLHRVRPDVQAAYPDPLETHQAEFAHWFCRHGASEFRLHPDLVRPVERSLPWSLRFTLWRAQLKNGARPEPAAASANGGRAAGPQAAAPMEVIEDVRLLYSAASEGLTEPLPVTRTGARLGVNVAGYFGMETGVGQVARGNIAALRHAGFPAVAVPLDERPEGKLAGDRIHQPEGAPFPLTLLHANADETARALSLLPIAGSEGGIKVGYWFWELSHFPLSLADSFGYLHEVWAPSRFCEASFAAVATVPIRYVPPCVPAPQAAAVDRSALGLEAGRFYFFFCFDVLSVPERKNPFAAIEAIRRLARVSPRPVGLLLKVTRARLAPELVGRLAEAVRGLPVVLHTQPASRRDMDALLLASDAYLSLHRSEGLGLLPIESLYLEKPVVATGYGGVTDFLDETTGFPVRYQLARLERDYTPYPRGAVWAEPDVEHAVAQMRRVLEDPGEATRRARAGRQRVERIYGLEAASQRLASEIARVHAGMAKEQARPAPAAAAPQVPAERSSPT